MQENSLVRWLRDYPQSPAHQIVHGIGDDGAVLSSSPVEQVVTTDLICDGTHFLSTKCTAAQIGRKAMAVNLSDIAAMGAKPVAAFISLLLPSQTTEHYVKELLTASISLANEFDCLVAGGDTNTWTGPLAVNVLITGQVTEKGPLLRNGANPEDVLMVTGKLGGSLAGHHFEFTPRIREALKLHTDFELTAGMDLSDGLAIDLRRLCEASQCGAEIIADQIPISNALKQANPAPSETLNHALGDGEDFELLFTASPQEAARILDQQPLDVPITAVGRCLDDTQLWLVQNIDGEPQRQPLPQLGYEHESKA